MDDLEFEIGWMLLAIAFLLAGWTHYIITGSTNLLGAGAGVGIGVTIGLAAIEWVKGSGWKEIVRRIAMSVPLIILLALLLGGG